MRKSFFGFGRLVVTVWLAMTLAGCAAIQVPVPVDESLAGMRAAVRGAPGTWVYAKEGMGYVLGWAKDSKYAVVMLDSAGNALKDLRDICATPCNWESAAQFLTALENDGWKIVPSGTVPAWMATQVSTLAYLVGIGSRALPTILLMPAVIPDPFELINPGVDV